MSTVTKEQVIDRLRTVNDPELHQDLVKLKMIKEVSIEAQTVTVHVELTTPACPLKDQIKREVASAVMDLPGVSSVETEFTAKVRSSRGSSTALPGVKNIVAVGAGKGGVGKSTIATLLAVGLSRCGAKVGLMDADVYGPSIPTMLGVRDAKPTVNGDMIQPIKSCGVSVMSIGFMVDPGKALIWRGPMVHGVVKQFLEQVEWGELDYLIVDLPPGTGDVPLTLAQAIPMSGSVIVCTPQDVALADARRAIMMYQQLNVSCLGIIENMSYHLCTECGHREELFDHGGAARAAADLGVPFLGEIPLNIDVRIHGDSGTPEQIFTDTKDYVRSAIDNVINNVAGQISIKSNTQADAPTLSIS